MAWYSFTSLVTNYATCMTTLLLLHTKIRKMIFTNTLTNRSYSISRRSRKNNYVNITFSWLLGHPWRPTDYEQQFTENRHIPTDCKTCHLTTWPLTRPQPYEIIILIRWAQLPKQSFFVKTTTAGTLLDQTLTVTLTPPLRLILQSLSNKLCMMTTVKILVRKWICILSNFIVSIQTHSVCQMWAIFPVVEFVGT